MTLSIHTTANSAPRKRPSLAAAPNLQAEIQRLLNEGVEEIGLDYETFCELDLKVVGLDRYISHPSLRIIMVAWTLDRGATVNQWTEADGTPFPIEVSAALLSKTIIKRAYNAQFERAVTNKLIGPTPYHKWKCTMVEAYRLGFAGTMGEVGGQIGFAADKMKDKEGSKLIQTFCKPQKPTKARPNTIRDFRTDPDLWAKFASYNRQDVVAECAIAKRIAPYTQSSIIEDAIYALDQRINDKGVRVDPDLALALQEIGGISKKRALDQLKKLTGLANPNSVDQIGPWLRERGYPFQDLNKDSVKVAVKRGGMTQDALEALVLRAASSRNSIAKMTAILDKAGEGSRFRYFLQICGAQRTWRWAGRNLQPQNLPRTPKALEDEDMQALALEYVRDGDIGALELIFGDLMEVAVGLIRATIIPTPGKVLRVADLSSIESVIIGWLTNCRWFMETLRNKKDLYRAFAAEWLHLAYDDTKPHRSKAKPATLGCGYRLGGGEETEEGKKTGLWGYAENMGVVMTRDEAHSSVKAFRELCPEIVQFWYDLENAAMKCLRTKESTKCGVIKFHYAAPFLQIELPSGRRLSYYKPGIEERTMQGSTGPYKKKNLFYYGRTEGGARWGKIYTHGGKLVENIVQAIGRDVLALGMLRADNDGFDIVMHVHDEIITEAPIDDTYHTVERLIEHMSAPISWAPGLPLGAAGWEGLWYRKD